MNIFFDMDYTLLGIDGSLRPGTHEIMQQLKEDGHTLYLWSGAGTRRLEVQKYRLEAFITDCFYKPIDNIAEALHLEKLPVNPDLVIDDHPGVPAAIGGIWIRPYLFDDENDNELKRIYQLITHLSRTRLSTRDGDLAEPGKNAIYG